MTIAAVEPPNPPDSLFIRLGQQIDRRQGGHLYRQIGDLLQQSIHRGELLPGQTIPTQRTLSRLWGLGEVTIRRALQALAEAGYIEARPGAGTVVLGPQGPERTGAESPFVIGIAFTDLADGYPFFAPLLHGLRADDRRAVAVRLFDLPGDAPAAEVLRHVPLQMLDGLILMSPLSVPLLAAAQAAKCPVVALFSDFVDGYSRCITVDYTSGMAEAVLHLVAQGRRHPALITAAAERFSTGRLVEAFNSAVTAAGLSPGPIVHAGYQENHGYRAMRELLARADRPDAVLCASDFQARGALLAAHEAQVRVPQELAIIGAGQLLGPDGWPVPLTTIDLGLEQMGTLARQTLERCPDEPPPLRQTVASKLVPGQTG